MYNKSLSFIEFNPVKSALILCASAFMLVQCDKAEANTEIDCLAQAMYHEARGEPLLRYIGDVIFNRVQSKYFPNTICSVVNQPYQFSYTLNSDLGMYDKYQKARAYRVATKMYNAFKKGTYTDITKGALYYYAPDRMTTAPDWASNKYYLFEQAGHRFYSWHKNA